MLSKHWFRYKKKSFVWGSNWLVSLLRLYCQAIVQFSIKNESCLMFYIGLVYMPVLDKFNCAIAFVEQLVSWLLVEMTDLNKEETLKQIAIKAKNYLSSNLWKKIPRKSRFNSWWKGLILPETFYICDKKVESKFL